MEYTKRRDLQNIVYFIRTDKEAEARMLGCFEILKIQFSYCRLLETFNDGFESHLDK